MEREAQEREKEERKKTKAEKRKLKEAEEREKEEDRCQKIFSTGQKKTATKNEQPGKGSVMKKSASAQNVMKYMMMNVMKHGSNATNGFI